ncbi:YkuS family protein [Clostridium sp. MB40-C1]|uniref:YkuS family protein n=1 Tax=Clostridium sp. MB40-C1 TaxID=3070996 RepID=UPI0027E20B2A|nr:YkuS family protein [Clostridium sp. MB40-C1]WMJ79794.1 YkuS family protein [Clostridium sp. MB40-C1]
MYYIAVENGLDNLANYLTEKGYKVDSFYESQKNNSEYFQKYDAIVTNNINRNILEIQDEITGASGINSDLLGIQYGISKDTPINTGILNENALGLTENFTSVPIINAYNLTPKEVTEKLHSLR